MFPEIKKRFEEILNQCGENPDLLEVVRLSYITALIDAGVIPPNKKSPV